MNFTEEQLDIIQSNTDLKVNAVAGSGKTSTLLAYAKQHPDKRILYLVFNKSVKEEAKLKFQAQGIRNTTVETAHSLAFGAMRSRGLIDLRHQGYTAFDVRELLQFSMGDLITEMKIASHVVKMASCFCNGPELKLKDCPYLSYLPAGQDKQFTEEYFDLIHQSTRALLGLMHRRKQQITHEFYLKQYQLTQPRLNYDIILFDEGQDASGVMLDIFLKQSARKVIVGDQNQQIYSWRYAINALTEVDFEEKVLTNSFRFPQDIADIANDVLARKEHLEYPESPKIKGLGQTKLITSPNRATLGRTNSGILVSAIEQLIEEKDIKSLYFEGNFETYTYADENGSIWDILNLHQGKKNQIRNNLIRGMKGMTQLKEYAEETNDSPLKGLIEIVVKYQSDLPYLIKQIRDAQVSLDDKDDADMIFSTIHKAKGMEYDQVTLTSDFLTEDRLLETLGAADKGSVDKSRLGEEINLLYVGVTRTKQLLNMPNELLPVHMQEPEEEKKRKDFLDLPYWRFSGQEKSRTTLKEKRQNNANAYKKWTKAEDQELRDRYAENQTIKRISQEMGRNRGAIYARLEKLGLRDN